MLILVIVIVAVAAASTVYAVLTDGYRRVPTH